MFSRQSFFLGILIVALLIFIFAVPSYGWQFRNALGTGNGVATNSAQMLEAQNETLQAELAELHAVAEELPQASSSTIRAMAYSRYPLNFRSEIIVNAGVRDGVAVGQGVTFQGVLIGIVHDVFSDSATVMTIFDPQFKIPVRIGNKGVDALLSGGGDPEAGLIAKDALLVPGDIIYTAAPGIPYGIPVAKIATIAPSSDNLFQQASLAFAYDINNVETVEIEK